MNRTLRIGIADYDEMKARTMAIARGELRPGAGAPTAWFTSLESMAKVLSQRNRELLELIADRKPASITELEGLSGRAKSNLSRTLKTMQRYGLVELVRDDAGRIAPRVAFSRIELVMPLVREKIPA